MNESTNPVTNEYADAVKSVKDTLLKFNKAAKFKITSPVSDLLLYLAFTLAKASVKLSQHNAEDLDFRSPRFQFGLGVYETTTIYPPTNSISKVFAPITKYIPKTFLSDNEKGQFRSLLTNINIHSDWLCKLQSKLAAQDDEPLYNMIFDVSQLEDETFNLYNLVYSILYQRNIQALYRNIDFFQNQLDDIINRSKELDSKIRSYIENSLNDSIDQFLSETKELIESFETTTKEDTNVNR